jgi:hypothetical protein
MKIIKLDEVNNDTIELEILKKKQSHYEANLALITKKMREIIYKYDTAKMDYTSRAKKG